MPPCGYRPPAVASVADFLSDNLDFFCSLYRERGLTVEQALLRENVEIDRIIAGARGGRWAAAVVSLNAEFYRRLAEERPDSWEDARRIGRYLIREAEVDLAALLVGEDV